MSIIEHPSIPIASRAIPLHPTYFGEYNGGYDASQTPSAT